MTSFLKLTPELLEAVGAKTEDEFTACLISKLGEIGKPDASLTATVATVSGNVTALTATVAALPKPVSEARITEIAVSAVPADILAKAKSAGSQSAVSALANTGSAQPAAANPAGNSDGGNASPTTALVAAGKFEEAYAADPKLQEEFVSAKSFAAFKRSENRVFFRKPAAQSAAN